MTGEFTWHGGRLDAARAWFGKTRESWIDLSTGINPWPWPGAGDSMPDWHALPSIEMLRQMEEKAARYFGVDPQHICALPGSEIGLRLLTAVLPLPGFHLGPAYRSHSEIFPNAYSMEKDERCTVSPHSILLANPNNPDGRVFSAARMREWLKHTQQTGSWLIVDEAFADVRAEISLAGEVGDESRLIIFRSFGKFFGLAGVRLGFVLGPSRIVDMYRRLMGDWPIHAAGLAIGMAAYDDKAWIGNTRVALDKGACRLDEMLRGRGLEPIGGCPLFRLIETAKARPLFEHLAERAILTRPFDYAPNWLRIGLPGDESAWDRLEKALADG